LWAERKIPASLVLGSATPGPERPSGKTRPFLYTKGKRYALRALISLRKEYELQQAVAINNAGQILLNGVLWRNRVPLSRVFLLTPIR
jgi:hypothetical protein